MAGRHRGRRLAGHAEQLDLLSTVLRLWTRVPGAAEEVGVDREVVLAAAGDAATAAGAVARALELLEPLLAVVNRPAGTATSAPR